MSEDFSYYFCLMIEGSGSGRPKNIRIPNTGQKINDERLTIKDVHYPVRIHDGIKKNTAT
jgi:hypothetical protein